MSRDRKRTKIIVAVLAVVLCAGLILERATWGNVDFLSMVAEGLDQPSVVFNKVIERIYKLSERQDIGKKLTTYLRENRKEHHHNLYIRILGVLGDKRSANDLLKIYVKYQHDENHRSTIYRVVDSLGFISNEEAVPVLERLLTNYDRLGVQVTQYTIARALYLSTGKSQDYKNESGTASSLVVTKELLRARQVIVASRDRKRTFDEMMVLERLLRPPNHS